MALTQTGATYKNQSELQRRDRILGEGLDDIASQVAAARIQGNFGLNGPPDPPSAPTALQVTAESGIFTATVIHHSAPAGTQYILQHSTAPNFPAASTISETLNSAPGIQTTWQRSLPGKQLYFRIAPKFPASPIGRWVYVGTSASPTQVG
jgi:hypothetical protein